MAGAVTVRTVQANCSANRFTGQVFLVRRLCLAPLATAIGLRPRLWLPLLVVGIPLLVVGRLLSARDPLVRLGG